MIRHNNIKTITPVNRNAADARLRNRINQCTHTIYIDYNVLMERNVRLLNNINITPVGAGPVQCIDYTMFTIDHSRYINKIKNNDTILQRLRDIISSDGDIMNRLRNNSLKYSDKNEHLREINKTINTPDRAREIITNIQLLKHLRSYIPDNDDISDANLLSLPTYNTYRNQFNDTFNYTTYISSLITIPTPYDIDQMHLSPDYVNLYNHLRKYIKQLCVHNLARKVLSKCTTELTRQNYARIFCECLQQWRSTSDEHTDYQLYLRCVRFDRPATEPKLISKINNRIMDILTSKEIKFDNISNVRQHFTHETTIPHAIYTELMVGNAVTNMRANGMHLVNTNNCFKTYLNYIECDVYYYDMTCVSDETTMNVTVDRNIIKETDILLENDQNDLSMGTYSIDNYYKESFVKFMNNNNALTDRVSQFLETYFFMQYHMHRFVARYSTDVRRPLTNFINVPGRLMSLLFVIETLRESKYFPQDIHAYLSQCISYIAPVVSNNGNAVNFRSTMMTDAANAAFIPIMFGNGINRDNCIWWICAIVGCVILVAVIVIIYKRKTESFTSLRRGRNVSMQDGWLRYASRGDVNGIQVHHDLLP